MIYGRHALEIIHQYRQEEISLATQESEILNYMHQNTRPVALSRIKCR